MVVTKDHILVGVSERTTMEAAHRVVSMLFDIGVVKKVTVIRIPKKRDYMHIDTIFTQVKRNVWVILGVFSRKVMKHENADPIERILQGSKKDDRISIIQFKRKSPDDPEYFELVRVFPPRQRPRIARTCARTTVNSRYRPCCRACGGERWHTQHSGGTAHGSRRWKASSATLPPSSSDS